MSAQAIHVIARALIEHEGHVLIARCKGAANTFLPGGHVRIGERMHDAITRELQEEIGRACSVVAYLGAIEHSFTESGVTQHEVNHLFEVELRDLAGLVPLPSREKHLEFFWQPSSRVHLINLQPKPLVKFLRSDRRIPLWSSTLDPLSRGS